VNRLREIAYRTAVMTLARLTGLESIIQQASSNNPREVFNGLVLSVQHLGSESIGSVDSTALMVASTEVMLATAPPEAAAEIRETVAHLHSISEHMASDGSSGARG